MCTHALPDDILELILVRLDSTACLIRASSTCKRWRRVVAGVGFLRRFRSIHGPPIIAGTYDDSARFTPTPSSGIDGRHFSLDFLPGSTSYGSSVTWVLKDTCAGFVLLERKDWGVAGPYKQDLVICDPLSRSYEIIAPFYKATWFPHTKAFLLDGDNSKSSSMAMADGGSIGLSNFRVICVAYAVGGDGSGGYEAGVFTSGSSCGWCTILIHGQSHFRCFSLMGHSEGKIYWWVDGGMAVVVDRATADLASFVLRDGVEGFGDHNYEATVTTGRNGEACIAVRRFYRGDYVKVFAARQQELAARGIEWVMEKTIRLPAAGMPAGRQWHDGCWSFSNAQTLAAASCQRNGTVRIRLPAEGLLLALDLDSETIEAESALSKLGYPVELPWPPVLRACRQPGTDLGDHDR